MRKRFLLKSITACYCCFVLLYLVTEYVDNKGAHAFFAGVGNPFLEQHWNMFAPNPPAADKKILVRLYNAEKESLGSTWLELTGTIREENKYNFFGSSQRLIKYLHGTLNPVLRSYQEQASRPGGAETSPAGYQDLSAFKSLHAYIKLAISRSGQDISGCSYYKLRILHTPVAPIENPAAARTTFILLDSDFIKL